MTNDANKPNHAALLFAALAFCLPGCDETTPPQNGDSVSAAGKSDAQAEPSEDEAQALADAEACGLALEDVADLEGRAWTATDAAAIDECEDIDVTHDVESEDESGSDKETTYIAYSYCRNMCISPARTAFQAATRSGYGATRALAEADAEENAEYAVVQLAYQACGNGGINSGCDTWSAY